MKSDPAAPADQLILLRQQLILAQVRIMELEDERDSLAPRFAELQQLVQAAQSLADRKIEKTAHLGKVLAELQAHCDHLQQASQELAATRTALADATTHAAQRDEAARRLEATLRLLEAELQTVKSSRSWRWTAWLRSFSGKP